MSKQSELLEAFKSGNEFTAKEISSQFGIKNAYSAVRHLRKDGHCIYANEKTLRSGESMIKYRLGTPSKRIVAAAARAVGADVFSR